MAQLDFLCASITNQQMRNNKRCFRMWVCEEGISVFCFHFY